MAKPRKQTYTMDMYLNKIKDKDIRSDADVQRLAGQWDNSMMNELIAAVLTDDYIPPIILGEESNSQLWVIDGSQRSTSLELYRYGNYKITSVIDDSVIPYKAKARDESGSIRKDKNGDILWEDVEFDIKNKTYDELPYELKKRFNEYQIETVIHENCDMKRISKLIKRYNNHTSMNTTQKAFTYIDNYARDIRGILDGSFFVSHGDYSDYSEKEKTKGVLERVILESVMCMFHLDDWKKQTKQIAIYLNENATKEEFARLNDNLLRLEKIITSDIKDLFNSKDSFIWLTLFGRYTGLKLDDSKFAEFLRAFKAGLRNKAIDGELFDEADKGRGTKDKAVIISKLNILEALMLEFLHIRAEDFVEVDLLAFVRENVNLDTTQEDVDFYNDILTDLTLNVDNNSKLLDESNKPSLISIIAYACNEDIDLDKWIVWYFEANSTYLKNQKENYLHMKAALEKYVGSVDGKSA